MTTTITLTDAEHATVLAALRYWQREGITGDPPPEEDIATDAGKFAPLDTQAIDRLCERLNMPAPPREVDAIEIACRAAGWEHGGDGDGFIFHMPTWGSWKAAASWEGTHNEPSGPDAKPATYSTWADCYANEIEV